MCMFNMKIKVIILFVLVNINVYSQEDTLTKILSMYQWVY